LEVLLLLLLLCCCAAAVLLLLIERRGSCAACYRDGWMDGWMDGMGWEGSKEGRLRLLGLDVVFEGWGA
jgi:hypothetical protein